MLQMQSTLLIVQDIQMTYETMYFIQYYNPIYIYEYIHTDNVKNPHKTVQVYKHIPS